MSRHAIAMVRWDVFRPGGGRGGAAVYDYGSNQERLLQRVADGGTLWLVTSRKANSRCVSYHLAYKLANCGEVDSQQSLFSGKWKYVVRSGDWGESRHFRYNEANDTLRQLHFTSGRPMLEVFNIGLRLLSIPELTASDVVLLERLQHKIENGRAIFISYSHSDSLIAAIFEDELLKRDISASRDVAFLQPGQEWEAALQREVTGTDCFMVLISSAAAESKFVRREVGWALAEYKARGLVKAIIPVVTESGAWDKFPELHCFQRWYYPASEVTSTDFDKLARGIVFARKSYLGNSDA